MDPIRSKLRNVTAGALSTSARALSLSSRLLDGLSGMLKPAPQQQRDEAAEEPTATGGPERLSPPERRARRAAVRSEQGKPRDEEPTAEAERVAEEESAAGEGPQPQTGTLRADAGPGPVAVATPFQAPGAAEDQGGSATTGRTEEPPTEPVTGVDEHARTYETHVEELAAKPAADVISAVEHLSTDELERLYSHEQANKKRKTVIAAIEASLSPQRGG